MPPQDVVQLTLDQLIDSNGAITHGEWGRGVDEFPGSSRVVSAGSKAKDKSFKVLPELSAPRSTR